MCIRDRDIKDVRKLVPDADIIETSLADGSGIEEIEEFIENMVYGGEISQSHSTMVNNVRHIDLLARSRDSLNDARSMTAAGQALEFIEVDVRSAYESLGEITGETVSDDIINEVFARFCLGK